MLLIYQVISNVVFVKSFKLIKMFINKLRISNFRSIVKSDILYLKSDSSYTDIVTKTEKVRHYVHLKEIVARLKVPYILRTHNSYAVNTRLIQRYDNETLYIYGHNELHSIPLGITYKAEVMKWLPKL